jgi:hypothetical protein
MEPSPPTEPVLDVFVARYEATGALDEATLALVLADRALQRAWIHALKNRLALHLGELSLSRSTDEQRAIAALEQRVAVEKALLRALVDRVDSHRRSAAPMPCLKVRVRRVDDEDDE